MLVLLEEKMIYHCVCSYCSKEIGTKEGDGDDLTVSLETLGVPIVTHTICDDCLRKEIGYLVSPETEDV